MTDIVERLRAAMGNPQRAILRNADLAEAADHIERLEAALREIEHVTRWSDANDKLEAALREIEIATGETMLATNHGRRGDIANAIARAALEGKR